MAEFRRAPATAILAVTLLTSLGTTATATTFSAGEILRVEFEVGSKLWYDSFPCTPDTMFLALGRFEVVRHSLR